MGRAHARKQPKLVVLTLWLVLFTALRSAPAVAQVRASTTDAQQQVATIIPAILDSEAENAAGAYVPGVGAVFTVELVRGPNTSSDQTPAEGTINWTIYLMQTFGGQLTAVPPSEVIAFSVRFYDFDDNLFHLLVVSARAGDVADPALYLYTLDGETLPIGSSGASTPIPSASTPEANAPVDASPIAGAVTINLGFDTPTDGAEWLPVAGTWAIADGSYQQTELGRYDLVSYYNRAVTGDYQLRVQLRYLDGQMGGGVVFNAPDPASKNLAQMVSFAGGGTYLQWGSYDSDGVFQYQGGIDIVQSVADGQWHSLAIRTSALTYNVILDGKEVARDVPLLAPPAGYLGLLASTSAVAFDNLEIVSTAP